MTPAFQTLTILVPAYNEERWLGRIVRKAVSQPLPDGLRRQIVIVDDGSTDRTPDVMRAMPEVHPGTDFILIGKTTHDGKGAALREGLAHATGDILLIQDADLEYDPGDYPRLLAPVLEGRADVVFGSRLAGPSAAGMSARQRHGNAVLTWLCNRLTGLRLTDMECGYKVFTRVVYSRIAIESRGFGVEPELTIKAARLRLDGRRVRFAEAGVSYAGRGYPEGKKIRWRDALKAVFHMLRFRFG